MRFKGDILTLGIIGAWAWKNFVVNMAYTYSWTDLEGKQALYTAHIFENQAWDTRIGYRYSSATVWIGARWMSTLQEYEATFGNVQVDLKIHQPVWNLLVGTNINFHDRVDVSIEAGIGDRLSGSINVGYRF